MEKRVVSKTWRVDPMGHGHSCGRDDIISNYCVCFASEREGKDYHILGSFSLS